MGLQVLSTGFDRVYAVYTGALVGVNDVKRLHYYNFVDRQEDTATFYTDGTSLCLPFYTDCIFTVII